MTSHPLIEMALDQTEQQFIDFVEQHARARDLPDDTIRLQVSTSGDDDLWEARHSVEIFVAGERAWRIEHWLKRTEAQQSRWAQLETRFELTGVGVPDGYGRRADIEAVVDAALGDMRALQPGATAWSGRRFESGSRTCRPGLRSSPGPCRPVAA